MRNRTRSSVINSGTSATVYMLKTLIGFVSRTIFIKTLGVQILGLNGLFTNLLSFLSLAELGIGTSIVFELYRPIATADHEAIKSLMRLYRRAYTAIGLVIGTIGISIMPIIPLLIKNYRVTGRVYLYFFLFLLNSVISYFFTYKRSMLNADQTNFLTVINDFIFYCVAFGAQMVSLLRWHSFIFYLLIQVIATLFSNISITIIVDRKYSFLREKSISPVSPIIKKKLAKNIVGNVSSQIGAIVVLGSDNLLLSSFVGLTSVGLYSNYTLISNAVRGIISQATNAIIPSVGNLIVSAKSGHTYSVFKSYWLANSTLSFIAGTGLFTFINKFVKIWIGGNYVLADHTALLMSIYVLALSYQGSSRIFSSAFGLFWQQRWKPLFEIVVNLAVSIALLVVCHMGIDSVLIGTLASTWFVDLWFEPFVLFRYGFSRKATWYILNTVGFYCKSGLSFLILWKYQKMFPVNSLSQFILFSFFSIIVISVLYILLFGRNPQLRILIRRFLKKSNRENI